MSSIQIKFHLIQLLFPSQHQTPNLFLGFLGIRIKECHLGVFQVITEIAEGRYPVFARPVARVCVEYNTYTAIAFLV